MSGTNFKELTPILIFKIKVVKNTSHHTQPLKACLYTSHKGHPKQASRLLAASSLGVPQQMYLFLPRGLQAETFRLPAGGREGGRERDRERERER